MNADKTQILWLGTRQQLAKLSTTEIQLLSSTVEFSSAVSNLGVLIDGQLNMDNHVASLCRSCFFQLRQLRTIRSMLTKETTVTLIHAFISSRLDYCNSFLYGISSTLLRRLQSIQNAAARLVTGAKKFDHITPVLRELHWQPIRQRTRISCHSWCTSACTMLHQSTPAATVYRYHRWPGDDNCVPLSVAPWTISGQELFLVVSRSECAALRRGTLCRQNCVLLLCAQTLLAKN